MTNKKVQVSVVSLIITVIATLGLVLILLGGPAIRILNDNDYEIGLRGCTQWREISPGSSTKFGPAGPCYVYRVDGHFEIYLGCLYFSDEILDETRKIRVSELDGNVTHEECERSDTYFHKSRLGKAWTKIAGWLPP